MDTIANTVNTPPENDPNLVNRVLKIIDNNKGKVRTPIKNPYYNKECGEVVLGIIKRTKESPTNTLLLYPTEGKTLNTIRRQFYEGLAYLKDRPEHNTIPEIHKIACRVNYSFKRLEFRFKGKLALETSVTTPMNLNWKDEFILYFQNAKIGEKLHSTNVSLTPEDIDWLNSQVQDFQDQFACMFSPSEILIVKIL